MNSVSEKPSITEHRPFSQEALFERFHATGSSSKHLLTIYSMIVGVNAKTIIDIGLGQTTGAIRAAAKVTGGVVYSCDFDKRRYASLLSETDDKWKLFLESSETFIPKVPDPVDFVMHDGAHDYLNVRRDIEALLPKMRQFGIICLHDTQQVELNKDMLAAIKDGTKDFPVSVVNLPYGAGMAILRVEADTHPAITPAGATMPDGRSETSPMAYPTLPNSDVKVSMVRGRWTALRIKAGSALRQSGLKK